MLHTFILYSCARHIGVFLQDSSSSESLDWQSLDSAKSYDAVVFDVLKVTPEEFAVSWILYRNIHNNDIVSSTAVGPLKETLSI